MAKIGIIPLGRETFDVKFANEVLKNAISELDHTNHELFGSHSLLVDTDSTVEAIEKLSTNDLDLILVLQVTFTDASMIVEIARKFDKPLAIWAFPEPRNGTRLRLNSFCGLNLASHALGLLGSSFAWLYQQPNSNEIGEKINKILDGIGFTEPLSHSPNDTPPTLRAKMVKKNLTNKRIARIGTHPDGFDTCRYDKDRIMHLTGVEVREMELSTLFDLAESSTETQINETLQETDKLIDGLNDVNQTQLFKSLKLKVALEQMQKSECIDAFAIRCWPETFTEYGGAVCGPISMMGEKLFPCACEADVFGSVSNLLLQEIADEPVFLVDLVDLDPNTNTGVVWHCGQAPISMADPDEGKSATIHSNRKMPLLFEFPLKPGKITLTRLSQARGELKLVVVTGEILKSSLPYAGTSGVFKPDHQADTILNNIMHSGLEHHMTLAYGDHRDLLFQVAALMEIPVIEL